MPKKAQADLRTKLGRSSKAFKSELDPLKADCEILILILSVILYDDVLRGNNRTAPSKS
jgi:hypothetical protein